MKKPLYVQVSEDLYYVIKDIAYLEDKTMSQVVEDMIRAYISSYYTDEELEDAPSLPEGTTIRIPVPEEIKKRIKK